MIADTATQRITTQIGSLPFDDVETAIAYSLKRDIPFLPELTALGDGMTDYIKNPRSEGRVRALFSNSRATITLL